MTLTYMSGNRPGIYRFRDGRLVTMDRVEVAAPPPKKPQRVAKTAKPKKPTRPMSDPDSAEFAARRRAARARLDAIDDAGASDPYRRDWFEAVYQTAGDDPAQIPWADLAAHPLLAAWLADVPSPAPGARALDVGCGLGDNAAALAAKGWQTTGFDLSATGGALGDLALSWRALSCRGPVQAAGRLERHVRSGARVLHLAGTPRRAARRSDGEYRGVRSSRAVGCW